jgi:hypothetical protein
MRKSLRNWSRRARRSSLLTNSGRGALRGAACFIRLVRSDLLSGLSDRIAFAFSRSFHRGRCSPGGDDSVSSRSVRSHAGCLCRQLTAGAPERRSVLLLQYNNHSDSTDQPDEPRNDDRLRHSPPHRCLPSTCRNPRRHATLPQLGANIGIKAFRTLKLMKRGPKAWTEGVDRSQARPKIGFSCAAPGTRPEATRSQATSLHR